MAESVTKELTATVSGLAESVKVLEKLQKKATKPPAPPQLQEVLMSCTH